MIASNLQLPSLGFWLWLVALFLTIIIIVVFTTAWAVRHALIKGSNLTPAQSHIVLTIAEFPGIVKVAFEHLFHATGDAPVELLMDKQQIDQSNWVRQFPALEDSGYLLFSGVSPIEKHFVVQLIRISDGKIITQWNPDWSVIYDKITTKKFFPVGNPSNAVAFHPLLLDNGDIIFNTKTSLVRLAPCSIKPVWVLDEVMHHSIEFDTSGAIWVPSVAEDGYYDNKWLQNQIRDDALALVSTDGRVLFRRSFAQILRDNGFQALLMGSFKDDPIHLNEIKVAFFDSKYWKRGDLFISAKNLSTVFLYRPSINKIIWHQTGPWMNQHSVDIIDDHRISIFNNNVIGGVQNEHAFITSDEINQVLVYDFSSRSVSQPFATLLANARPVTVFEGRARILSDGGLFVEETNEGRLLRFTKDRLLWSRINDYDDQRIGGLGWSRYLTLDEVRLPLQALASRQCKQ